MGCGEKTGRPGKILARAGERFWPFTSSSMFPWDIIYDDESELFHNPHQNSICELLIRPPKDF